MQHIVYPHLLVRAISEWLLPTGATFRACLASEIHWLQLMLTLTVHWWPASVSVGGLIDIQLVTHFQHTHAEILVHPNECQLSRGGTNGEVVGHRCGLAHTSAQKR